jgi:hypothetical protein
MAEELHAPDDRPEPAGESIHLPGPSYLPVAVAAGLTILIGGVVIAPFMVVIGLAVTAISIVRWVRDARREMAELPLEH